VAAAEDGILKFCTFRYAEKAAQFSKICRTVSTIHNNKTQKTLFYIGRTSSSTEQQQMEVTAQTIRN
jgi:hypothetical protein